MIGPFTWLRYYLARFEYAHTLAIRYIRQEYDKYPLRFPIVHPVPRKEIRNEACRILWKNLAHIDRLTFLHWSNEGQMTLLGTRGGTLLVRRIAHMNPETLRVGDVVVHKDPKNLDNILVRQIAAVEDWVVEAPHPALPPHLACNDFRIVKDQCWVSAQNKLLDCKRAYDSRAFGPLYLPHILGRAIYCVRTPEDHGPILNSPRSMDEDSPIIEVEMDMDEMIKNLKQ